MGRTAICEREAQTLRAVVEIASQGGRNSVMIFASVHKTCQHLSENSPGMLNTDSGSSFPTAPNRSLPHRKGVMSTLEVTGALSPSLPVLPCTLHVSQNLLGSRTLFELL